MTADLLEHRHGAVVGGGPHGRLGDIVLVTDLDGTLAFDGKPPGPAVVGALESIAARGDVRLVLASSRPPPAIRRLMGPTADATDLVGCNGAIRTSRGGVEVRRELPRLLVEALVVALRQIAADFCIDYGEWFLAGSIGSLPWKGSTERIVMEPAMCPPAGALKVAFDTDGLMQREVDRVVHRCRGRAEVVRHTTSSDIDVMPLGVDKSTALADLLGGDRSPVVAFGNDVNDIGMLQGADHGVVVGRGLPDLDRLSHVTRVRSDDVAVGAALCAAVERRGATSVGHAHDDPMPDTASAPRRHTMIQGESLV